MEIFGDFKNLIIASSQTPDDSTINDNNNIADNSFNIYPNPNNGIFKIRYNLSENNNSLNIEIYNMYGQLEENYLYSNITSGYQELIINTKNLENGIYLIKLSSNNFNKVLKLFIKN